MELLEKQNVSKWSNYGAFALLLQSSVGIETSINWGVMALFALFVFRVHFYSSKQDILLRLKNAKGNKADRAALLQTIYSFQ